jgi:hypothetical protein
MAQFHLFRSAHRWDKPGRTAPPVRLGTRRRTTFLWNGSTVMIVRNRATAHNSYVRGGVRKLKPTSTSTGTSLG